MNIYSRSQINQLPTHSNNSLTSIIHQPSTNFHTTVSDPTMNGAIQSIIKQEGEDYIDMYFLLKQTQSISIINGGY